MAELQSSDFESFSQVSPDEAIFYSSAKQFPGFSASIEQKEEEIEWEDRPTCWMSRDKQLSSRWKDLHVGRISMSNISKIAGRVPPNMRSSPHEIAKVITGVADRSFDPSEQDRMRHGIQAEPLIRQYYSDTVRRRPIYEVGLAVWKRDVRFGGSLDGEFGDFGIEIKAPEAAVYHQLVQHVSATKRGFTPPSKGSDSARKYAHIFDSHLDQMIGNMVITGKTHCDYVVACLKTQQIYYESIPANASHWYEVLYPAASVFYDQHVQPLMNKHHLTRIDPPEV